VPNRPNRKSTSPLENNRQGLISDKQKLGVEIRNIEENYSKETKICN
jgi:hypothetical protein